jgi:prephenate dehydratase
MPELVIAYLGPKGTYTEWATLSYLDHHLKHEGTIVLDPHRSIQGAFQALSRGDAAWAVVPVENSVEGSVGTTLDCLWSTAEVQIQQALVLPIHHNLISKAATLEDITRVYTHPQSLAQCQLWLEKNLPQAQLIPTSSNTEALESISQEVSAGYAAIASARAAKLFDLPILASSIHDYPDNQTRFLVIGLHAEEQANSTNTSLAFSLYANRPGVLNQVLDSFARRKINLAKIESRPTKTSLGSYLFFLELESNQSEPHVQEALAEIQELTERLKVFGSYTILPLG